MKRELLPGCASVCCIWQVSAGGEHGSMTKREDAEVSHAGAGVILARELMELQLP